jgi:hypothetical protein
MTSERLARHPSVLRSSDWHCYAIAAVSFRESSTGHLRPLPWRVKILGEADNFTCFRRQRIAAAILTRPIARPVGNMQIVETSR